MKLLHFFFSNNLLSHQLNAISLNSKILFSSPNIYYSHLFISPPFNPFNIVLSASLSISIVSLGPIIRTHLGTNPHLSIVSLYLSPPLSLSLSLSLSLAVFLSLSHTHTMILLFFLTSKDAMLREYQDEIKRLKDQLDATQRGVIIGEDGKV